MFPSNHLSLRLRASVNNTGENKNHDPYRWRSRTGWKLLFCLARPPAVRQEEKIKTSPADNHGNRLPPQYHHDTYNMCYKCETWRRSAGLILLTWRWVDSLILTVRSLVTFRCCYHVFVGKFSFNCFQTNNEQTRAVTAPAAVRVR